MLPQPFSRRHLFKLAAGLAFAAQPALAAAKKSTPEPKSAKPVKLATQTEIVAGKGQLPILSTKSMRALKGAVSMYQQIVDNGGWPDIPKVAFDKAAKPKHIFLLRERLVREGYLDVETLSASTATKFDQSLTNALKSFQANHGLRPSGQMDERTRGELNVIAEARLDMLLENAPRIAEHSRDLGARSVLVNIPSAQLETVDGGQVYSRHNVVVGKIDRPTPSLRSRVSDVIFNPSWSAPASIVEKDIIPKMLKDAGYLKKMNIHVLDGPRGPEIDPRTIDWEMTAPDRYVFKQAPGEHNALATVKVNFPNNHSVYMHDTPHRELFASNNRFESSGCVRVDKVKHLITWILNGQYGYDESNFDPIIAGQETQVLRVGGGPDVRFMYLTAWATADGHVNFRPDIYRLDGTGFVLGQPEPQIVS